MSDSALFTLLGTTLVVGFIAIIIIALLASHYIKINYPEQWEADKYKIGASIFGANSVFLIFYYINDKKFTKYKKLYNLAVALLFIIFIVESTYIAIWRID